MASREVLEARLKQLREGLADLEAQIYRQQGAILILEQLLQDEESSEEDTSDEDSSVGK